MAARGRFTKVGGLRVRLRQSFFAGTGLVKVEIALHNPSRARHRGGLWDLGDRGSVRFSDLSMTIALPSNSVGRFVCLPEADQQSGAIAGSTCRLYQDSSGGANWNSPNHVNRAGRVACRFRGYRLETDGCLRSGLRATPILATSVGDLALSAAFPEFWQQFPKAVSLDPNGLRLGLFPQEFDDLFELQGGERKTHSFWLQVARPGLQGLLQECNSLRWIHEPVYVRPATQWRHVAGAAPDMPACPDISPPELIALLKEGWYGRRGVAGNRE
jgi:hypothetical protein